MIAQLGTIKQPHPLDVAWQNRLVKSGARLVTVEQEG